jgi:hypothetical protein
LKTAPLFILFALAGCFKSLPKPNANLPCAVTDECPSGYECRVAIKTCCRPGDTSCGVDAGGIAGDGSPDQTSQDSEGLSLDRADLGSFDQTAGDAPMVADGAGGAVDGQGGGTVDGGQVLDSRPADGPLADVSDVPLSGADGSGGVGGGETGDVRTAPTISSFAADPATISTGQSSTLNWAVTGATLISLNQGIGLVAAIDSEIVSPTQTTIYTLTAQNAAGESVSAKVTVTVGAPPSIELFTATPSTISVGEGAILTASFTNAVSATIDNGLGDVANGATVDTGALTKNTTYTLTVTNSIGAQTTAKATVTVVALPTIASFVAASPSVSGSASTTLTATFSGGTGAIDHGPGKVDSGVPVSTGALTATTTFTLTVSNAAGATATKTVTVTRLGFSATGPMAVARCGHSATLLLDGTVLVAGGGNGEGSSSAEIYDPVSGTFSPTKGAMLAACSGNMAALLPDGKVLLACASADSTAQLYDPASGTFLPTKGAMVATRQLPNATVTSLRDGKVLIAGGSTLSALTGSSSAELYDPTNGTFAATDSLAEGQSSHTATLLSSGKVLIAGGRNGYGMVQNAQLYDPTTGTFILPSVPMVKARWEHTATLLRNGKVLFAGGTDETLANYFDSVELFDPTGSGSFVAAGAMAVPRAYHTATLLTDGRVIITGGVGSSSSTGLQTSELFDASGVALGTGSLMTDARSCHTATLLTNGQVLISGGVGGGKFLSSAELYTY